MLLRIDVFFFFFFFEKMANRRKCLNTKLDIKISGFFQYLPSKTILAHESSLAVKQCFIWLNWKVSAYYNSLVSKRLHVHRKEEKFSGERTCTSLVRFIFLHLASYVGWVWFRYLFFSEPFSLSVLTKLLGFLPPKRTSSIPITKCRIISLMCLF